MTMFQPDMIHRGTVVGFLKEIAAALTPGRAALPERALHVAMAIDRIGPEPHAGDLDEATRRLHAWHTGTVPPDSLRPPWRLWDAEGNIVTEGDDGSVWDAAAHTPRPAVITSPAGCEWELSL